MEDTRGGSAIGEVSLKCFCCAGVAGSLYDLDSGLPHGGSAFASPRDGCAGEATGGGRESAKSGLDVLCSFQLAFKGYESVKDLPN